MLIFGEAHLRRILSAYTAYYNQTRTHLALKKDEPLAVAGRYQKPSSVSSRACAFLLLSGLATGASWLCYFRAFEMGQVSQVAPVDEIVCSIGRCIWRDAKRKIRTFAMILLPEFEEPEFEFKNLAP